MIGQLGYYSEGGAGAGHGGEGGKSPSYDNRGPANDYFKVPEELGSGAEKTHGGGAVKINTNTLILHGTISAK